MPVTFYATNNFTGNGTTTVWNINFADGYLSTADVKARYVDNTGAFVDIAITSVVGNVVTISPAQPAGRVFSIYRDTQKSQPLVDFADGAILNETNLDVMATQAVMVAAEASDLANGLVGVSYGAQSDATLALSTANTANTNATNALSASGTAVSTANTALTNANTAITTANAANATANGIASTANTALANSQTAINTANSASSTANAIAGTANTALSNSNTAISTANSAASDAATALSTANSANSAVANKANKGANSDITSLSGLTTALSVAQGGTGGATASAARSNLSAAASGVNNDITQLTGLTTPLSVAQGGTGANNATTARSNLSAATRGANSDITSLTGLTTPLSIAQGGTSANTAGGARVALGVPDGTANGQVLTWNGTAWTTVTPAGGSSGRLVKATLVTATNAAFALQATTNQVRIVGVGGGGGGRGATGQSTTGQAGWSGASGMYGEVAVDLLKFTTKPTTLNITIGTGGAQNTTGAPSAGGATTVDFGSTQGILTFHGGVAAFNIESSLAAGDTVTQGIIWGNGSARAPAMTGELTTVPAGFVSAAANQTVTQDVVARNTGANINRTFSTIYNPLSARATTDFTANATPPAQFGYGYGGPGTYINSGVSVGTSIAARAGGAGAVYVLEYS